jgi:4-amino-4-deoxy-L-arabinose transferase-like glycosyltransferase
MAVPALAIAAPWYLSNFRAVIYFVTEIGYGRIAKLFEQWSLGQYYFFLINNGMSAYIFLSGAIALIVSLFLRFKKAPRVYRHADPFVVLVWFLVPLGMFSFSTNREIRYLAPGLPALGILISVWFSRILSDKKLRRCIAIYSILLLYLVVHLSFRNVEQEWRLGPLVFLGGYNHYVYRPVVEDWKNEEVVRELQGFVTDHTR